MSKSEASKGPKSSRSWCTVIFTVLFGCICIGLVGYGSWKDDTQKRKRNDIIHRIFINGSIEIGTILASVIDIKTIEEPKSIVSSLSCFGKLHKTVPSSHNNNIRINMTGTDNCDTAHGNCTTLKNVSCDSCLVCSDAKICSPCINSFEIFVIVKRE